MANPAPPRRRILRRWKVLAVLILGLVALVLALPLLLGTPPAKRRLLARANRALTPGRLQFEGLRVSWFGPTRLSGVALYDPQGEKVVASPRATWDRNLFRILFDRDNRGTLTLEGASLDIERHRDGTIDVVEALKPILRPNPALEFHLRIPDGPLRFRSPELANPLTAQSAALDLDIPGGGRPLDWRLRLANGPEGRRETLAIDGRADRVKPGQDAAPDLQFEVSGERWPLGLDVANALIQGRYDGKAGARREGGRWTISGEARVLDLDASSPSLAGDRLLLDEVGGHWRLVQADEGWAVEDLDVRSPVGSVKASGRVPAQPGVPSRIEGTLDLAALAGRLPHALPLREGLTLERGEALLVIDARAEPGRATWDASARITDLVARDGGRPLTLSEPATLSARWVGEGGGRLDLDHLGLKTAFLDAHARGDLDRGIALDGTIDLGGLRKQAGEFLDLGDLEMEGKGTLSGSYRKAEGTKSYAGDLRVALAGVRLKGTPLGTVAGEAVELSANALGPIAPSGLPRSWDGVRLAMTTGSTRLDFSADPGAGNIDLTARLTTALTLSGSEGRVGGDLRGRWEGEVLSLDALTLDLRPAEGEAPPISLAARGEFDSAKGLLTLSAHEDQTPRAIALGPEGIRVAGLGRGGKLDARATFVGGLAPLVQALRGWTDAAPADLAGAWSFDTSARRGDDGLRFGGKLATKDVRLGLADDPAARRLADASLTIQGTRPSGVDRLDFHEIVLASKYATLEAAGSVDDPRGKRLADLKGTLTPDWAALNEALAGRARLDGKPRPAHLKGALSGDSADAILRGLDAEIGLDLAGAESFGMHLGAASIVARSAEGGLTFDPIRSTLNGGTLALEPEVARDGDSGLVLRLKPGAAIVGAEINDEVSREVLAFVAPVLDAATRARGKVSVDVQRAEFPIGGDPSRRSVVEGHVVFQEAEFAPGPLAVGLLRLAGRDEESTLRLDQPVVLSVADGKVHQRGLALPLGKLSRVELDGAVGFDRSLDLKASLPLTPAMVNNNPLLGDIVGGARVSVPIGGTLDAPKIDRDAFNLALKGLGQDLLRRGAARGAAELLMRLAKPREVDPNAPPRPTPEERRNERLQRKLDRQERRAERRGGLLP